jgi:diguanylate cyclase (GGDEF)-like protein
LRPEQVAQLTTLATQAGARIGTVRAFQRTQLQASTDSLTGLINRRTLEANVRDLIHGGDIFAFALADLDRFKNLNDTHGHEVGDRALRLFAQVVQGVLRGQDVVARYGGEEFAIVLPGLDLEQAVSVLERVRTALAEAHGGDHPAFTTSFGVTDSSQAEGLDRLLQIADQGLYVSKESGRDKVTIGDPAAVPERVLRGVVGGELRHVGRRGSRPALHAAVDEYEPRPSGAEIR